MADTLAVSIDVAEQRVKLDRQVILHDGRDWDLWPSAGVAVDVVTSTAFLLPLPYDPAWQTTGGGAYARTRQAQTSVAASSVWTEYSRSRFDGDYALLSLDDNSQVTITGPFSRNRGHFLSWFAHNNGQDTLEQIRCGWGTAPNDDVWLSFWSDGSCYVYDGTAQIGSGNLTRATDTGYVSYYGAQETGEGATGRETANRYTDVVLLPCRRREMLILSNQGGGFTQVFDRITDDDPDPEITTAGPFWFQCVSGQANVQHAPLRYSTAGTLYGPEYVLRYPPISGCVPECTVLYDTPGYGVVSVSGTVVKTDYTAYTPDGAIGTVRAQILLAGDGEASPSIYGAKIVLPGTVASTADDPTSLIDYLDWAELSVPESPSDVRLRLQMRSPGSVEAAGATNIRVVGSRPIEATIGTVAILTGRSISTQWGTRLSDAVSPLVMECQDRWRALETYRIQDPSPFDGMALEDAVSEIVQYAGFTAADLDLDATGFDLPSVGQASRGEYALMPEAGDTAADWLMRLWETYAKTWYMGWVPTADGPKFRFRSPESLGTVPAVTLYSSRAQAGGATPLLRYRVTDENDIEPEANDLYVWGRDPRADWPILAHYTDLDSSEPTTAVASRPENWIGEPRRYAWIDPSITSYAAAVYCLGILQERLTPVRKMREWECEMLLKSDGAPVWRGDVVRLTGLGDYRVETVSARMERENTDLIWRPSRYVGLYLGTA